MKILFYIVLLSSIAAISCASTPKHAPQEDLPSENTPAPVSLEEAAPKEDELPAETTQTPIVDEKAEALAAFKALLSEVTLSVTATPSEVVATKAFASPYILTARFADGKPAQELSILVCAPQGRAEDGSVTYRMLELTTQEDGTVRFLPETPARACNDVVRFTPVIPALLTDSEEAEQLAQEKSVTAPFLVRTRLSRAGGVLALVDFTKSGAPIRSRSDSSSSLLTALMKKGFASVGNIDFTDQIASGSKDAVYKAAKQMLGSSCAYLVYGTVKYAAPVEKTDAGFVCTLTADVTCLTMKDGSLLYHTVIESSATEKQEGSALVSCRTALTQELSTQLYYGL